MNYYQVFYWLTVADGVKAVFDTFSNIFTFLAVVSLIAYVVIIAISTDSTATESETKSALHWKKLIGKTFWFSTTWMILLWLGYVLTPTKKDCLLIVAGGSVGNFITTDTSAKQLPSDITTFLHQSLKAEIAELDSADRKQVLIDEPKPKKKESDELMDKVKALTKEELIKLLQSDTLK